MLKFLFVLELRWVPLFVVVLSYRHWAILQFTVETFKSTKYSTLLSDELYLTMKNVMYQSDAYNYNKICHLHN